MHPRISRRTYLAALTATSVGALGGCTGPAGSSDTEDPPEESSESWTTFRGDGTNSGVRSAEAGPGSSLSLAWELNWDDILAELEGEEPDELEPLYTARIGMDIPSAVDGSSSVGFSEPVLASSTVICSVVYRWYDPATEIESKRVRAIGLDQSSGEIRWSQPLGNGEDTDSADLDPESRQLDRLVWFGGEVVGETVVVPKALDSGVGVVVLDTDTGEPIDEFDLGLSDDLGRPRVADGLLFVVDSADEQQLYAFDLESGSEEWSTQVATSRVPTPPSISFEGDLVWTVETADASRELVAYEPGDGTEQLREPLDVPDIWEMLGAPTFGPDHAYVAGDRMARSVRDRTPLISIDPTDGSERWRYEPPVIQSEGHELGGIYGYPVVADGIVVAAGWGPPDEASSDPVPYLVAVNDSDGSREWTLEIETPSLVPVVAGETIYLDAAGPSAISLDGEPLDSLDRDQTPPRQSMPALGTGRLFIGGRGSLSAIE